MKKEIILLIVGIAIVGVQSCGTSKDATISNTEEAMENSLDSLQQTRVKGDSTAQFIIPASVKPQTIKPKKERKND